MNEHELIQNLEALKTLTPRQEVLLSVQTNLFNKIDQENNSLAAPVKRSWFANPFSKFMLLSMVPAFMAILVVVNQMPMHGAYRNSISAIAKAVTVADALTSSSSSADAIGNVKETTAQARVTLDTLKLKGSLGVYTKEQCLQAYTLFDNHLDYVNDYLNIEIPKTTDPKILAALEDLRAYVGDSRQEVQRRINMYKNVK